MSSKYIAANKHNSAGPAKIIAKNSVANLKSVRTNKAPNKTISLIISEE